MPDAEIGGIPLGIRILKSFLPSDKRGRIRAIRPLSLFLSYITYLFFSAARKPIDVVRFKVYEECNMTRIEKEADNWCKGTVFEGDREQIAYYLGSLYIGTYAVSVFFSGVIADSFNPRFFLTAGGLMVGFFSVVVGLANLWKIKSAQFFAMGLILLGAAQSTSWPVLLSCATHFYSSKLRRGLFFALWNTHVYIGGILGTYIAAAYVEEEWGWSFLIPGFIVALMSLVVFFFLVVHPSDLQKLGKPNKGIFDTEEIPSWLDTKKSIDYHEVFRIPGVIEYSACMFFTRMASYTVLYWYPAFHADHHHPEATTAYFSLWFALGGVIGGVLAGFLKDMYRKGALVCVTFLACAIPVLALQILRDEYNNKYFQAILQLFLGIFVEGPFILLSTSVSVDLGTHSYIRRGYRGLATVASIVEGTGALGATLGPLIGNHFIHTNEWGYTLGLMMFTEFLACLCLTRMAYREYQEVTRKLSLNEYWN